MDQSRQGRQSSFVPDGTRPTVPAAYPPINRWVIFFRPVGLPAACVKRSRDGAVRCSSSHGLGIKLSWLEVRLVLWLLWFSRAHEHSGLR